MIQTEKNFGVAALKSGMDEKTPRRYRDSGQLPSEIKTAHVWRTREDQFEEVWPEIQEKSLLNPGLEGKTRFEDLQRIYPQNRTAEHGVLFMISIN